MGLENLKTAFNNIKSNIPENTVVSDLSQDRGNFNITPFPSTDSNFINNTIKLKGGESIIGDVKHNFGFTSYNDIKKISPILNAQPDSPQTKQDDILLTSDKTRRRESNLFQNIGQNNKLGLGELTFESLYNRDHKAVPLDERQPINIGKFDENGVPIPIDILRSGMGNLSKLDIMGYSSGLLSNYRGLDRGKEPYIVQPIGSDRYSKLTNRDFLPLNRALDDSSRLLQYYFSNSGLVNLGRENTVNVVYGASPNNNPLRRFLDPGLNEVNTFRPLPKLNETNKILDFPFTDPIRGNTGFLNNSSFVRGTRKPFVIEYSKRKYAGLPFGFLGDNAVPPALPEIFPDPDFEKATTKSPRFLGLGSGRWTNNDKISDSGVIEQLGTDSEGNEALPEDNPAIGVSVDKGDFYVRLKDLRDNSYIYFRGFITGITENVSPSFTSTNYIGRSEPVYSYERAERDISFTMRVYPANLIQQNRMYEKIDRLTSLAYPLYLDTGNYTRMKPPFTELYMAHIGSRSKGQFGYIKSISYTVNESGDWDALKAIPRLFDIAISYQIINRRPPSLRSDYKFYGAGE